MQWVVKKFPRVQFIAALVVAAVYELYKKAKELRASLKEKGTIIPEIVEARLKVCRACPVHYAPLDTCGSPLAEDPSLGCHCWVRKKASVEANCWAYEKAGGFVEFGWPRDLNSYPYDT